MDLREEFGRKRERDKKDRRTGETSGLELRTTDRRTTDEAGTESTGPRFDQWMWTVSLERLRLWSW